MKPGIPGGHAVMTNTRLDRRHDAHSSSRRPLDFFRVGQGRTFELSQQSVQERHVSRLQTDEELGLIFTRQRYDLAIQRVAGWAQIETM